MISARTLTDGGQTPADVAGVLAGFIDAAERTLDLAIYDLMLTGESEAIVLGGLTTAQERGVEVRVVYNVAHPNPIPVPPPPECVPEDVAALPVPTRAVSGIPDLMHHKFCVRDGRAVLTGSTNWTDDSWARQENVLLTVEAAELGEAYSLAFDELWSGRAVVEAGRVEPRRVDVQGKLVRPWFCPGFGDALSHRVAKAIGRARRRVRICSPVISSGPVLGTLAQVAAEGRVDAAGCVDATQLAYVHQQWTAMEVSAWKIPLLETILERAPFSGKNSTPWAPGSLHDFMHAKVTVADDVVFCGSFNLSRSGERNAEDMLEVHDPELADELAAFVDAVRARYPRFTLSN
ncbi:MAG TPA: phosphatidylserine/phosphatidylglycerophosphate/cardiolipin synthase family protein [Gaiellaceae bacterium]|nr:phosphatidylserine/phosphatidylglycerophosphate/cardiolipin synthase family protein [Gaiellaceae bacterium]